MLSMEVASHPKLTVDEFFEAISGADEHYELIDGVAYATETRAALEAARGFGPELVPLRRTKLPYDSLMGILFAEAAAAFEELTLSGRDDQLTWQTADAWPNAFRKARFLSAVDHIQLDRLRRLVMEEMDAAFRAVDVIIGPSLVGPMMVITNFTGHPCLCLPAGHRLSPTRNPLPLTRHLPEPQSTTEDCYRTPTCR